METYGKKSVQKQAIGYQNSETYSQVQVGPFDKPKFQSLLDSFDEQLKENYELLYNIEEKLNIILNKRELSSKDVADISDSGNIDLIYSLTEKLNVFNNHIDKLRGLRNHLNEIA